MIFLANIISNYIGYNKDMINWNYKPPICLQSNSGKFLLQYDDWLKFTSIQKKFQLCILNKDFDNKINQIIETAFKTRFCMFTY